MLISAPVQQHINVNVATYNTKKIIINSRSRMAYTSIKNKIVTTQEIVTKTELVTQTICIVHPSCFTNIRGSFDLGAHIRVVYLCYFELSVFFLCVNVSPCQCFFFVFCFFHSQG